MHAVSIKTGSRGREKETEKESRSNQRQRERAQGRIKVLAQFQSLFPSPSEKLCPQAYTQTETAAEK